MVSAAHSRSPGREQGSAKPVDEAGSRRRRRSRGSKAPTRPWSIAAPERATADETILELLERGAEAHGFRGEAWTCERVAIVIRTHRVFGVSYHPALM